MTDTNPSYMQELFGGFDPQTDAFAAMKLVLNAILMDHRLDELAEMIRPASRVGGLEGEPGWSLEWTVAKAQSAAPDAMVVARVDPQAYRLAEPNVAAKRDAFLDLAEIAAKAYELRGPEQPGAGDLPALKRAIEEARSARASAA